MQQCKLNGFSLSSKSDSSLLSLRRQLRGKALVVMDFSECVFFVFFFRYSAELKLSAVQRLTSCFFVTDDGLN